MWNCMLGNKGRVVPKKEESAEKSIIKWFTLATALLSELLLESLMPFNESLLCGHGFFLRGLPLRFGAEN